VFWVILVYFNIRNTLPKSGTFLLGPPVYRSAPVLHTSVRCIYSRQILTEICGASKDLVLHIAVTLLVVQISRAVGSGFGILRLVTAVNVIILFSSLTRLWDG
jgi:hypothetical protein